MQTIDVVAAVRVRRLADLGEGAGHLVWLCRRTHDGAHGGLAGLWEYPGGKVEPGEDFETALVREMQEEFGTNFVSVGDLIDTITTPATHTPEEIGQRLYRVHFFQVYFHEEPVLNVHSEAQWMGREAVHSLAQLPSGTKFNERLTRGDYDG